MAGQHDMSHMVEPYTDRLPFLGHDTSRSIINENIKPVCLICNPKCNFFRLSPVAQVALHLLHLLRSYVTHLGTYGGESIANDIL